MVIYYTFAVSNNQHINHMKTLLHIETQLEENYSAHNWDGEGKCPEHWKPKGGHMFTLQVNSDNFLYAEEQCVKAIKTLLAKQSNDYERFTYISHELIFHEPTALNDEEFELEVVRQCREDL